ncbi:MAG: S8 family serine peptidase [Gemmatimonadaceae bacterium]
MKTVAFALAAAATVACAPATPSPAAPAPARAPAPPAAAATPARPLEAPQNWHLLDAADRVPGISLLRAERELLAGKQPRKTVVVAILDGGVDTAHAALRSRLWSNPRETPGNGRDDENNGFIDDTFGWNLIGGRDGRNVHEDTYEVTRLAAQCKRPSGRDSLPAALRSNCAEIEAEFGRKRSEAEGVLQQIRQIEGMLTQIMPYLRRAIGSDSVTKAKVEAINSTNDTIRQARGVFLQLAAAGLDEEEVKNAKKAYQSQVQFGYNPNFDPRAIVADNYPDTTVKRYGNRDVTGPDAGHGTHVAGIVAAQRDGGGTGIASSVRIMAVRVVPDGDERDKDVANAIRYAVDQGANVINMSFGKAYSPYKSYVDAAIQYADSKGVLMVHGAGNDAKDLAVEKSFPTPVFENGSRATNWIEVGATSWKGGDSLVANFSNYGKAQVDVFAPGVDIYSTYPGGGYKKESGTSMASPVVAGLAALLMSYYPTLTAADVKRIIMESSTKLTETMVVRPGPGGGRVKFGDLSATGGIVNAYEAIKLAEQRAGTR